MQKSKKKRKKKNNNNNNNNKQTNKSDDFARNQPFYCTDIAAYIRRNWVQMKIAGYYRKRETFMFSVKCLLFAFQQGIFYILCKKCTVSACLSLHSFKTFDRGFQFSMLIIFSSSNPIQIPTPYFPNLPIIPQTIELFSKLKFV